MGNFGHPLRASHASPSLCEGVLCTTLPLDAQGGIKGGLDLVFRFALRCPAPLDSGFRRNDGGYAQHPKGRCYMASFVALGLCVEVVTAVRGI